ncbi:MAG TPA: rRNA maturation RNase YbeY [Tepidisphaeraceae bacterium]|nr:rRNA maturation RNase YbeY [Tepidisphaeraceae bacterium]
MRLKLNLKVTATLGKKHVPFLKRHLQKAYGILKPQLREMSLALVGDKRMAELHQQFLGIPGPTDVLTFPLEEDSRGRVVSGEVVVCVPEARRRAASHGSTLDQELLLYALHGMLHLIGFDDRTPAGFRQMHRKEDQILTRLGVGPVFSKDRAAEPTEPK